MSKQLIAELQKALPKGFVKDLMRSVDWAYDESQAAVNNDKLLGAAEAAWLKPYYRRCILENAFKKFPPSIKLNQIKLKMMPRTANTQNCAPAK